MIKNVLLEENLNESKGIKEDYEIINIRGKF